MITPHFDVHSDVRIRVHHFTPMACKTDPVVVMCHPTGFCGLVFASVVAHLRGLNIYAIDVRSHGYSDRGNVNEWDLFGQDLVSAFSKIKDRSDHNKFVGIGISSGSSAHILNSAMNHELYSGLYLCEPIMFTPDSDLANRGLLAESARNRRERFESADDAYFKYLSRGALSKLSPSALALYCVHGFKDTTRGIQLRCSKVDEEAIYLSGGANGVYDSLSKIKVPTRFVYGEHSKTVNSEQAEIYSSQIQGSTTEMLAGTGHFTLFENPYLGAKSITTFIDSLEL